MPIEEKLRIVEETLEAGATISAAVRRNSRAPSLLYRWRRLMTEGGVAVVQADDGVTGNAETRKLEQRERELACQLCRKTLEAEALREALAKGRPKNRPCSRAPLADLNGHCSR